MVDGGCGAIIPAPTEPWTSGCAAECDIAPCESMDAEAGCVVPLEDNELEQLRDELGFGQRRLTDS